MMPLIGLPRETNSLSPRKVMSLPFSLIFYVFLSSATDAACISMFVVCVHVRTTHCQLHLAARFCSSKARAIEVTNEEEKLDERRNNLKAITRQEVYHVLLELVFQHEENYCLVGGICVFLYLSCYQPSPQWEMCCSLCYSFLNRYIQLRLLERTYLISSFFTIPSSNNAPTLFIPSS